MKRKETPKPKVKKEGEKPKIKAVSKKAASPESSAKPKSAAKPETKSKSKLVSKSTTKAKPGVATKKPKSDSAKTDAPKIKAPAKPRRPKSFEQLPVVREHGFAADVPDLPENYLRDRLVLMTQAPDVLFSYWEVTPSRIASREAEKLKGEEYREAMRLNWPARSLFDANFVLIPVSLAARRWYLRVPFPGLSYQVEIGWVGRRGHFVSILGSNESETPENWEATRRRLRESGELMAHFARVSSPAGSSGPKGLNEKLPLPQDWNPDTSASSGLQSGVLKKTSDSIAR